MPAKQRIQYGPFWLGESVKSPFWQICWYETREGKDGRRRGQVYRRSTGAKEVERAKAAIEAHYLEWLDEDNQDRDDDDALKPNEMLIVTAIRAYCEFLSGRPRFDQAMAAALHLVGDDERDGFFDPTDTVSVLKKAKQRSFVEYMAGKGLSSTYTRDVLGVLRAALNHTEDEELLTAVPKFISVEKNKPLKIRWSLDEMSAFISHIEHEHLWMFTMTMMNTLSRPEAVLECHIDSQVDFENSLVHLNPDERVQTKKYRPVVPLTDTLRYWLEPNSGYIVKWHGSPVERINKLFKATAIRAGLDKRSSPYAIRRGMSQALRATGYVPWEQIEGVLGHSIDSTSDEYAIYDPQYMSHLRIGIDALMKRLEVLSGDCLVNSTNVELFSEKGEADKLFIPNDLPAPNLVGERGFEPPAPTSRT